jgi:hypothetical protein
MVTNLKSYFHSHYVDMYESRAPKRGLPACRPPQPQWKLKKTDFVDTMISDVLLDLPFSRNQPKKSADDWHSGILRNKMNLGSLR